MQKREATISVAILLQMLRYMKTISVDAMPMLNAAGISADVLNTPDVRISAKKYLLVQTQAAEHSKDPWFGLNMGRLAEFSNWAILGYVVMNCASLEEALSKMNLYLKALSDMIVVHAQQYDQGIKIQFTMYSEPLLGSKQSHCIEASLSSQVHLLRKLTGKLLSSVEVHFPYSQPPSTALHEQIFGANLLFNQPAYGLVFDKQALETPILSGNPTLLSYFEQYAQERLKEAEDFPPFAQKVSHKILEQLPDTVPLIGTVARSLSMSVRSLQKQLKQDGYTYSALLNHIRVNQMNQYLKQGLSIEEISFLLGFSEPSVFRKACKKWTGLTPGQYRKTQ